MLNMAFEMNRKKTNTHIYPICTNTGECEGLQLQLSLKCTEPSSQNCLYAVVIFLTRKVLDRRKSCCLIFRCVFL